MKSKFLSGVLISLAFPVCGNAVTTDDGLKIGTGNVVLAGSDSAGIGDGNYADSLSYATVGIGFLNEITRSQSTTVTGSFQIVDFEDSSLVAGLSNEVTGVNQAGRSNIVLGSGNTLTKAAISGNVFGTVLLGSQNQATTSKAWALGQGNIGQYETVTLGTYASTVSGASLIVGTGTDTTRSNGLVVLKNGKVQIPGSLEIGVEAEPVLTTTSANAAGYITRVRGTGATATDPLAFAAWGPNAKAETTNSFAAGANSRAYGWGAFAMGSGAAAGGTDSLAFGTESIALGDQSVALLGGKANGMLSIAGAFGETEGMVSLAFGFAKASGNGSIALGGIDQTAWGTGNLATGESSTAIGGFSNSASGLASLSSGNWAKATSAYSIALGSLNKGVSTSSTDWVQTDPLFELGNGNHARSATEPSSTFRSNAITTLKNGRTTLTNKFWVSTTPEVVPAATDASAGEALAVEGHAKVKGNATIDGTTILNGKVILATPQGDISMGIYN